MYFFQFERINASLFTENLKTAGRSQNLGVFVVYFAGTLVYITAVNPPPQEEKQKRSKTHTPKDKQTKTNKVSGKE